MHATDWILKTIRVDGLLNSHDIEWNLHPKVNILGGVNGSGKSTMLHALAILLQGVQDNKDAQELMGSHCEAKFKAITALLESGNYVKGVREVTTIENIDNGVDGNHTLSHIKKISFKVTTDIKTEDKSIILPWHVIYVNSADMSIKDLSRMFETSRNGGHPATTTLDLMVEQALNTRNKLFTQRVSRAMQSGNNQLLNHLTELFGRFETAFNAFMGDKYSIEDMSALQFRIKNGDKTKIKYNDMSAGEKQLLYVLLTVCNTLGEPTVLLLDDAETGMHVDWQQILLRELVAINPRMQILAATHAPNMVWGWRNEVKEMSQLYLDRD